MVDIAPFRGVLYNPDQIKNVLEVVTPPYDVITPEGQDFFYGRHDYNVIRLDLGKETPQDTPSNNRYTRAAAFFNQWQAQGILKKDARPAFYRYEITYTLGKQPAPPGGKAAAGPAPPRTLRGFFSAVRLEPFSSGRILPHENTFPKVKEDRLNLLRAARANFSPILMLYADPEQKIQALLEQKSASADPRIDFIHDDETHHRLWSVDDGATLQQIQSLLLPRNLLIADGHHRYETALAFSKEVPEANRMLMLLVNMDDVEGLSLLPIHRVLHGLSAERAQDLLKALGRHYVIESDIPDLTRLRDRLQQTGTGQSALGLYTFEGEYWVLRLKPEAAEVVRAQADIPPPLARLDVTQFDRLVLDDLLQLKGGASDRGTYVTYIKEPQEGVDMVKRGEAQMAFFLNPIGIHVVQDLAREGIKMPHKSTYFYPKPLSGLVFNVLT